MWTLRWICDNIRRDRIRNDDISKIFGVAPIQEKLIHNRLRWFGHIQRRYHEILVCSGIFSRFENIKRDKG
jgi:hypothetical protein